ncbi:helix-turn-helix domain-containing protein [Qingshengfaniella alkalisoli]|uniref:helix-turn-helix domain-containing protein n=1 Tax=Qingshengfaniella alkalisoli TaxID=2599296 RepID=UPI00197B54F9|nr:AraC family transcriptional regulator [Qingshengfaniella alkalisoli]
MSFRPNMSAFTTGIFPVEELRFLELDGLVIDLWHVEGSAEASGHYVSPDPRITIALDPLPLQVTQSQSGRVAGAIGPVSYVPAGMQVWGRLGAPGRFRHLDMHFDARRLVDMSGVSLEQTRRPVLMLNSHRIMSIASLIAEQCIAQDRSATYTEALVRALLIELFQAPASESVGSPNGGLSPSQLAKVTGHLRANLHRRVSVRELSDMAGLSPSWFAHAFKVSTGQPPNKWLQSMRVERAEELLARGLGPAAVANECGFSDQSHLTRSFRAAKGITPASWQRLHLRNCAD